MCLRHYSCTPFCVLFNLGCNIGGVQLFSVYVMKSDIFY